MNCLRFQINRPLHFHLCGKFISPTEQWIHLSRELTDFELFIVTKGILHIADDTEEYHVKEGEYLIMGPCENQHGIAPGICEFYWLHFSYDVSLVGAEQFISKSLKEYKKNPSEAILPMQHQMLFQERIMILMQHLIDTTCRYHDSITDSYLCTDIINELSNQFLYDKNDLSRFRTPPVYDDIKKYIDFHINEELKVEDLALYFNYNKKYIITFFKKASGITLKQYVLNRKIDIAKTQLAVTNHTISQIASNVGFNNSRSFSIAFKKITELSPTEYRDLFSNKLVNDH